MDPITHTMAGAVMARVGGDRRTPLAAATLMLAANAPDIDIYTVWTETSFGSIAFRRGWTHGPYALVLLPFVVTYAVLAWDAMVRRRRNPAATPAHPGWVFALSVIGVLSHPALDWLNTYGIRLLMPFDHTWFHGDALFIVDPYWWLLLGGTLWLARRGASRRTVRRVAAVALAYPLLLLALSWQGKRLARGVAAAQGIAQTNVLYQPLPANPFAAQLILRTDAAYQLGSLRWFASPRVRLDGPVIARGDWSHPAVIWAKLDPDVRDYLVWSSYPWVQVDTSATDGSATVVFGDARFPRGGIVGGLGGLTVTVRPRVP
jgi:inner membrane protein